MAQIVLRWLLQQEGMIALSRTTNPVCKASNAAVFDFAFTAAEMAAIHGLAETNSRIVSSPGLAPARDPTPAAR